MLTALFTALIWIGSLQVGDAAKSAESKSKANSTGPVRQTAGNPELDRQVRQLVRQLDAAAIAERDEAYAQLVKLGPEVLAHLPTPADNPPAAVRDAIRRLRREFDAQAADRAMQASTITLTGSMPLSKVAAEFEKQTGNKLLVDESLTERSVDLNFDKTPYHQALDAIADQAQLSIYSFAGDGPQLRPRFPNQLPRSTGAFYTGPLRFEASKLLLERSPRIKDDASLTVELQIAWEPRLRPITLVQKLDALKAADDAGAAVQVQGEGELPVLVPQGATAVEIELPFVAPARSAKAVATLSGTIEVLVPGKQEVFEFANLKDAKKTAVQRHNATVTLESVRKANDVWEARIKVKYEESFNAFDSHLAGWILSNDAYLVDAKGMRVENAGFETTNRSEDEIGVAYFFDVEGGLDGHKLMYHTPGTIYRLPVAYELKDLVLP
jgi:hypothetical protein